MGKKAIERTIAQLEKQLTGTIKSLDRALQHTQAVIQQLGLVYQELQALKKAIQTRPDGSAGS